MKADKVTVNAQILDAKNVLRAEFNEIVAKVLRGDIIVGGRMTSNTIWCYGLATVNDLHVYNGMNVNGIMLHKGQPVATQAWVNERLKSYASANHQHKYYVKHYHKIKIGNTTYDSAEQTYKASDTGRLTSGPV